MNQLKSAKDIAFEKERVKFRKEIRNLQYQIMDMDNQIKELNEIIFEKENELRQQAEWIDRLLEYTEIPRKDLQELIKNEKEKAKIKERVSTTLGIIGIIGGRSFLNELPTPMRQSLADLWEYLSRGKTE